MSADIVNGGLSEWFSTIVGVLQGCVLLPLLFNLLLEVVMMLSLHDDPIVVLVCGLVTCDLRFADDISLLADCELDLQSQVDKFSRSSERCGLEISGTKSEVQVIGKDTS